MEREPVYVKEVTIGNNRYKVNHPQVEEAWEIGIELLKMIGGSAASLASAAGDEDKAAVALGHAVTTLLNKVSPKESMALMKRILINVEYQGEKKLLLDSIGIKTHFHARTGEMLKLVGEVLAFTHADFFEAIADGVATLMKKAGEKMGEEAA